MIKPFRNPHNDKDCRIHLEGWGFRRIREERVRIDVVDALYQRACRKHNKQPGLSTYWKWRGMVRNLLELVLDDFAWNEAPKCPGYGTLTLKVNGRLYWFRGGYNRHGVACWIILHIPDETITEVEYQCTTS